MSLIPNVRVFAALLGYLFPSRQEIAFANYNLFKILGLTTTYAYAAYLTVSVKLYMAMVVSVCAIAAYFVLEIRLCRSRKRRTTLNATAV